MNNYSKNDVIIVRYPFSDISKSKIRPAVVISALHISKDVFIVPLTSRTISLLPGEFVLKDWADAMNRVSTVCRKTRIFRRALGKVSHVAKRYRRNACVQSQAVR